MTQSARVVDQWSALPMVIPRHDFARDYFHYTPGDHVVFTGPTQASGKTQLAFDLLEYAATPECPAYVAVSKPKDAVTSHYARMYDWRIVRQWPPPKKMKEVFGHKYSGYVVWPHFGDLHNDRENVRAVLSAMLSERYGASARSKKAKYGIVVMDDTRDKSKVVGLDYEMTTYLTMAGAMGLGEWIFVQKGSQQGDTALMAYPNAAHMFFFKDPTMKGREYIADIGGVDPDYITWVLPQLRNRQSLYIRRNGPELAIVDNDSRHGKIGLT
jgi:hypothetical protein